MIRLIRLGNQIHCEDDYDDGFAFFNTVTDTFMEVQGYQVFDWDLGEFQVMLEESSTDPCDAQRMLRLALAKATP